jgi:hypothetical protein
MALQAPQTTDLRQRLITAIREWVHMDNLAESFNQQAMNARTLRAKHEADAISLIKQMGMSASTFQLTGGAQLTLAQRRTPANLTWSYLEREVPAWASRAGLTPVQSAALIKWLQEHRDVRETEYLKKSAAAVPKTTDTGKK